VARLVYKEWARKEASQRRRIESGEWPPPQSDPEESDLRLDALRLCLGKMDEEQQHLVLEYHRGENNIEHRKKMAARIGIPINALRIRVFRLRRRLEECLAKRLAS
jgi:DNA-directed RNA polymerase specialized sigma24 family protein